MIGLWQHWGGPHWENTLLSSSIVTHVEIMILAWESHANPIFSHKSSINEPSMIGWLSLRATAAAPRSAAPSQPERRHEISSWAWSQGPLQLSPPYGKFCPLLMTKQKHGGFHKWGYHITLGNLHITAWNWVGPCGCHPPCNLLVWIIGNYITWTIRMMNCRVIGRSSEATSGRHA